jgi:putative ABC transport system substrate-binding protein
MVLSRALRNTWVRLALWTTLLGCGACTPKPSQPSARVEFSNPERRAELPAISVFAPADARLLPVVDTLRQELEEDFDVRVTPLAAGADAVGQIATAVQREAPRSVVLLNNSTAEIYRKWAAHTHDPPIAVVLMASFAHQLQQSIPNSVGIAYEMPAVTSLVGLRGLGTPVSRVGVVYRAVFAEAIRREEQLANVEHITFVKQELPEGFEARDLKASLVRLKRAGVDVMWLPNDNGLLTRQLVSRVWLPYLERLSLPVVVGVPSLVRADPAFGVFAAIPDPEALAIQAADLILELSHANWTIEGPPVRLPLSAKTYASAPLVAKFGLETAKLQNVDVVVGGGDQ